VAARREFDWPTACRTLAGICDFEPPEDDGAA
jgi:hypothetical protein